MAWQNVGGYTRDKIALYMTYFLCSSLKNHIWLWLGTSCCSQCTLVRPRILSNSRNINKGCSAGRAGRLQAQGDGSGHCCGEDRVLRVGKCGWGCSSSRSPAHHAQAQNVAWPHLQWLLDPAWPGPIRFPGWTLGGL